MSDAAEDKLRNKVLAEIRDDLELLGAVVADASVIANKRGFGATGWDALYLLFAERFSWSPEKVRSLTIQELSWMVDTFFQDVSG